MKDLLPGEAGDDDISTFRPAPGHHIFNIFPFSREEMKASLRNGTNLLRPLNMVSLPPCTKPTAYCAVRPSLSERYALIHRDRQGTVCAKLGTASANSSARGLQSWEIVAGQPPN